MHAIEFQAVASQRMLPVPEMVPEGIPLRILVLVDEAIAIPPEMATPGRPRQRPSPKLAGSVFIRDDLIDPAVPSDDWEALK